VKVFAVEDYLGSWVDDSGVKFHIVNGFKSGVGPVLIQTPEGEIGTTSWTQDADVVKISYEWTDYVVSVPQQNKLLLSADYYPDIQLSKIEESDQSDQIDIKQEYEAFIQKLVSKKWTTSYGDLVFKSTFSKDSGVATPGSNDNSAVSIYWAVSSDILKIDDTLLLEAKITDQYLVGLDQYDNFIVFKSAGVSPESTKINLDTEKNKFFDELLSGEWITSDYDGISVHRFRPVFGDLSGIIFTTKNGRLTSDIEWEYSPASGLVKIGYSAYDGALIVNDTLAFKSEDGSQYFYNRPLENSDKRYTLSDVTEIPLNEITIPKIQTLLNLQLQRGEFLHLFEFLDNGREGFVHKFKSSEFIISGETMSNEFTGNSSKLFGVEEFIVFDSEYGFTTFKMDTSESRLKPKTDAEVESDFEKQEQLLSENLSKRLLVRIMHKDGTTIDVPLPINDFNEIGNLMIVRE